MAIDRVLDYWQTELFLSLTPPRINPKGISIRNEEKIFF